MSSVDPVTPAEKRKITRLARDLVEWARENGRDLPWRAEGVGTYERVAVEVLLQRTTAAAVSRFYEQFFSRYKSWEELAAATHEDLEGFLKPLGLWRRRANSLLGLARYARQHQGRFPSEPAHHRDIPAVGQYVSNAILVFQHGRAAPLLDVNMARVLERFLRPRKLADIRYDPWLQDAAHAYVQGADPSAANWAILDFAAAVCKARLPMCGACPVQPRCAYGRTLRPGLPPTEHRAARREGGAKESRPRGSTG